MPYSNADVIVVYGFWRDEATGQGVYDEAAGLPATVTLAPVPLGAPAPDGVARTPNLRDVAERGWLKTRVRVADVDPVTGFFAALLVASDDPDLDAYGGRSVTFTGELPFTVAVPWTAPLTTVTEAMAAALAGDLPDLEPGVDEVKALPLVEAALVSTPAPVPAAAYLTATQTLSTIATGIEVHEQSPTAHQDLRDQIAAATPDATTTTKGKARLLAGTADDPEVPWAAIPDRPASLPPSGGAGGVLSGSYPNPGFAADMATQAELDAVAAAKADTAALAEVATTGDYADLSGRPAIPAQYADLTGTVPQSALPAVALVDWLGQVGSEAAMLALTGQRGDWATRTDLGTDWQLVAEPSTALASWREMTYPDSPVSSVNGRVGAVSGLAEQAALAAHTDDTANPHQTTAAQVGAVAPADLAAVATTGDYADLAGAPAIPDSPDDIGAAAAADLAAHTGDTTNPHAVTAAQLSGLAEAVQDVVGAALVAGAGIEVVYDDTTGTVTITATGGGGGGLDAEGVRDTIAATYVEGANLDITVDDAANTVTIAVTGLAAVATSGSAADLTGTLDDARIPAAITRDAELADVATSGAYGDLSGTPAIPDSPDDVGAQPVDADLTALAGLDSAQAGVVASDGAGWLRKTYAQVKTALGLTKADVGLGNVVNTAPADLPVSTAQQTALDGKAAVSHAHAAGDTTSGTFAVARIPTGTSGSTVALGDHTHAGYAASSHSHAAGDVTSGTFAIGRVPTGTSGSTVALGNHNHDGVYAPIPAATQTITYASTITPDASVATSGAVTATGAMTVNPPTGGRIGQGYVLDVTASGAGRAVTLAGFTLAGGTSPYTVPSGKTVQFPMRRLAGGWRALPVAPDP